MQKINIKPLSINEVLIELPFRFRYGVRKPKWAHFAPSLNKLLIMHFRTRMLIKEKLALQFLTLGKYKGEPFKKPVVVFKRYSVGTQLDNENLVASFKFIGDQIVNSGYYSDDSIDILTSENFKAIGIRVKTWEEIKITISISEGN